MAERVHDPGAHSSETLGGGGSVEGLTASSRRRLAPPPEEQKRREEWGRKWGAMVREAVAKAIGESK